MNDQSHSTESIPAQPSNTQNGYGKRPLWQWILLYAIVGGLLYWAIYVLVLKPKAATGNTNDTNSSSLYNY